jgi:hypothetical protein
MLTAGLSGGQFLGSVVIVGNRKTSLLMEACRMHAPSAHTTHGSAQLDAVCQNSPAWLLLPAGVGRDCVE